jgi:hypothetical protein
LKQQRIQIKKGDEKMKMLVTLMVLGLMSMTTSIYAGKSCCPSTVKKKSAVAEDKSIVKVCVGCGEIKGSAKCCKDDAEKCKDCKLNKGSVGCCKDLKAADGEKSVKLCVKCGEVKGTEKCCKKDAKKCGCGMIKGSPGCCKMPKKK